ncbi:MAG: ribosomal RNA small subunit methyltransferase A [Verrucomicrobiae bacterium]|nr:ribosomal RNA small subunit methyltransferase A [Verrucomicrobiae bacterium]
MTLTEIRRTLAALGIRPRRRLGQNFLHDQNVAQRIVELCGVEAGDSVVEIGPGLGALTERLLARHPSRLLLLEKDLRFAAYLREKYPFAELVAGDALQTLETLKAQNEKTLLSAPESAVSPFLIGEALVVGNLPYSVASPLLVRLAEADLRPRRMIFTIQLEVAERLAAKSDTKDYGLLTLLIRPFYEVALARRIPPSVFWPSPEVSSATIVLTRRAGWPFPTLDDEARFGKLVRRAFQQRRKTLGAIFGETLDETALRSRRPAELDVEEWARAAAVSFTDRRDPEADPGNELFEVVDAQDRVVGRAPRRRVHAERLRHRAVHVFVRNARGEVLLQRRSPLKDLAPNAWDSSAAGHLASGEDCDAGARREIVEELGADFPLTLVRKFDACEELGWEFIHLYDARAEGPFRFPASEIRELRWWTPADVDAAIAKHPSDFAASFRYLWSRCA